VPPVAHDRAPRTPRANPRLGTRTLACRLDGTRPPPSGVRCWYRGSCRPTGPAASLAFEAESGAGCERCPHGARLRANASHCACRADDPLIQVLVTLQQQLHGLGHWALSVQAEAQADWACAGARRDDGLHERRTTHRDRACQRRPADHLAPGDQGIDWKRCGGNTATRQETLQPRIVEFDARPRTTAALRPTLADLRPFGHKRSAKPLG
jgi:hypothetical protein